MELSAEIGHGRAALAVSANGASSYPPPQLFAGGRVEVALGRAAFGVGAGGDLPPADTHVGDVAWVREEVAFADLVGRVDVVRAPGVVEGRVGGSSLGAQAGVGERWTHDRVFDPSRYEPFLEGDPVYGRRIGPLGSPVAEVALVGAVGTGWGARVAVELGEELRGVAATGLDPKPRPLLSPRVALTLGWRAKGKPCSR